MRFIAFAFALSCFVSSEAWGDLRIRAWMEQDSLCVREPVKIYVHFENEGPTPIRIFSVSQLGSNMRYMFLELEHPTRGVEWRSFQFASIIEAISPSLTGEAILPGGTTEIILYPHMTQHVGPDIGAKRSSETRFTFDEPGLYTVRVAYFVPDVYEVLWRPPDGILFSDPFDIIVREPSTSEDEIMNAVWSGDRFYLLLGDDVSHLRGPDEDSLRDVVALYPSDPMIRHAKFTLGRMLAYDKSEARAREGLDQLAEVMARFPGFRGEECRLHQANVHNAMGDPELAETEYNAALERYPSLVDNLNFMTRKLNVECRCSDGFREWEKAHAEGRKLRSASQATK